MTSRLPSLTPSPTKSTRSGPSTPQRLGVGASMGPLALIVDYKCTAYVRATSHVEVGILTREVFQELINRFVDDRERLVRRILRAALDSSEHPMLWQFVQVYSGSNSGSPPGPGTSAAASASGAGASISVPPPLARQSTASSIQATSEKTISSRQGAKILVHAINLHSMGRHETLVLPLPLDPEAVRLPRGRERPSISRTATSSTPLRRTPTAERVTPQPTSTAVLSQPSIPQNTSTTETQIPRDLGPSVAKENDAPVGTGTNDQAIEDIIHTQAAMLHLVQTLTDSVSRLDAKLARIEERVHRTDDFTRYSANSHHHMLLRGRSSSSEGPNGLLRRQSSMNTSDAQESSHSDWRDGHLHAPRSMLPEEIAALQAAAAAFATGPSSSSGKSHATAGQGSTRSSVSETPSSTFDEGALDLNGVFVLSKHGTLSSPPSSRTTSQTTARHSPVKRPGIRSRSLSNSTRKRLTTFQHAITGMPITIHEPVVDTKRRASMSTLADQERAK